MSRPTVFCAGIGPNTTQPDLVALFKQQCGAVGSIRFVYDKASGARRAFCFVELRSEADVAMALDLNGSEFQGRILTIRRNIPREQRAREPPREVSRLFVAGLPEDARPGDVAVLFSPFGQVLKVHLCGAVEGSPRGLAFVTYEDREAADAAIISLNGTEYAGRTLRVELARPRDERATG